MFPSGWRKCSTKSEKFGIYGSLGKIENAKDEWQNRGANLSLVGCILGESLQYVGDKLFQKIQTCYKSLGVPSFDQVNYEANISANHGVFKFASKLTFTMNRLENSPHLDKVSLLYALGWWFQVVWASSTFAHYTDPAHNNESTTLVGMSAQCSRRLTKTMWLKSHSHYEIGEGADYHIRNGNTTSSHLEE
ncbi:hypothetical protein O181_035099 [Austropuccinia psidii MF-1]|uniref:Tet-like 2OG-Fe(II) oxygenase domain-containing protein n=1 Tax=Austropuccinia psidii MF-1 TaxID=1389203 RepID=A0A9Q3HA73_9BASI|nr:hypothetical protein [Austropuccinia psidii MF-1]